MAKSTLLILLLFLGCEKKFEVNQEEILSSFLSEFIGTHRSISLKLRTEKYEYSSYEMRASEKYGIKLDNEKNLLIEKEVANFFIENGYKVDLMNFDIAERNYEYLKSNKKVWVEFLPFYCSASSDQCIMFARFVCGKLCASNYYFLFEKKGSKLNMIKYENTVS